MELHLDLNGVLSEFFNTWTNELRGSPKSKDENMPH